MEYPSLAGGREKKRILENGFPQKKFALVVAATMKKQLLHIVDSLNRQNYPGNL